MISRRKFLQALGIGAAAIAAPVVGRRIWQVHRDAPVRAAKIYTADEVTIGFDFDDPRSFPPMHYQCRSVIVKGALVAIDENGELKPAEPGELIVGRYDADWLADMPEMREWLRARAPLGYLEHVETEIEFSL